MIYHWVGKDGLAPLAAAIHLGYLPSRVKTEAELRFLLRQELPLRKGWRPVNLACCLWPVGGGKEKGFTP